MCADIDTEPAPLVAPGLGANNRLRARTVSTEFIGLLLGAAPFGGPASWSERSRRSILTISSVSGAMTGSSRSRQFNTAVGGNEARRRLKELHHVH
jgi:hypothetical protein